MKTKIISGSDLNELSAKINADLSIVKILSVAGTSALVQFDEVGDGLTKCETRKEYGSGLSSVVTTTSSGSGEEASEFSVEKFYQGEKEVSPEDFVEALKAKKEATSAAPVAPATPEEEAVEVPTAPEWPRQISGPGFFSIEHENGTKYTKTDAGLETFSDKDGKEISREEYEAVNAQDGK